MVIRMREGKIDFLKGLLTFQMIVAHCLQFYGNLEQEAGATVLSDYINLTTFSGFLFCFGYASYRSYVEGKQEKAGRRLLLNACRLLLAFYASSFFYCIYVERMPLRMDKALELLLFKRLAGWSEFLFSFVLVMLLEIALLPLLRKKSRRILVVLGLVSVVICMLPHREAGPIAGSLVGGMYDPYFPVLPYLLFFFIGVYFAQEKISYRTEVLAVAVLCSGYFVMDWLILKQSLPSRFPLSLAWLLGPMLALYLYYLLAGYLEKRAALGVFAYFRKMGRSSLYYLLLSNLLLFSLKQTSFYKQSLLYACGIFVVILLLIGYTLWISGRQRA